MKILRTINDFSKKKQNRSTADSPKYELTVMVVDDSSFSRNILIDILTEEGHEVVGQAGDGLEALKLAEEKRPDFIFMDITMPKMDGLEALRKILDVYPEANIIMCSALNQKSIIVEALKAGAKDFIIKPYKKEAIIKAIYNHVDLSQTAQVIPFSNKPKTEEKRDEVLDEAPPREERRPQEQQSFHQETTQDTLYDDGLDDALDDILDGAFDDDFVGSLDDTFHNFNMGPKIAPHEEEQKEEIANEDILADESFHAEEPEDVDINNLIESIYGSMELEDEDDQFSLLDDHEENLSADQNDTQTLSPIDEESDFSPDFGLPEDSPSDLDASHGFDFSSFGIQTESQDDEIAAPMEDSDRRDRRSRYVPQDRDINVAETVLSNSYSSHGLQEPILNMRLANDHSLFNVESQNRIENGYFVGVDKFVDESVYKSPETITPSPKPSVSKKQKGPYNELIVRNVVKTYINTDFTQQEMPIEKELQPYGNKNVYYKSVEDIKPPSLLEFSDSIVMTEQSEGDYFREELTVESLEEDYYDESDTNGSNLKDAVSQLINTKGQRVLGNSPLSL